MATTTTIRLLTPTDARAYHALRIRALREHPEAFGRTPEEVEPVERWVDYFRVDAQAELDFVLGAFAGDVLAGMVGCRRERMIKHRHVAYIWGVYISTEHRGTGLGRRLFVAAVDRARTWDDLKSLWLDVTTTNQGARALYASCGFRTVAIKPRTLRVGDRYYDEEMMMLDLDRGGPGPSR
jgi:RimJ/RimL family protein N-acetyltransferase